MEEIYKPADGMRYVRFGENEVGKLLTARSYDAVVVDSLGDGFTVMMVISDHDLPQFLKKMASQLRIETLKDSAKKEEEKWTIKA